MAARGFGWLKDRPDARDWMWSGVRSVPTRLPRSVDLSRGCSPVENQGRLGSCTANALVGALEFLELRDGAPFTDLSRLFVYYNERVVEHSVASDSGAMLRDGIKTLAKTGVCRERLWPYRPGLFSSRPPAAAYAAALDHQVTAYRKLLTVAEMRACLAEGFPFVFGFTVYESLQSDRVARTGEIPLPDITERAVGGHAVLAVGYDDARQVFRLRNSWGRGWGRSGYGTIPYEYLDRRNLSDDFWTIRRQEKF